MTRRRRRGTPLPASENLRPGEDLTAPGPPERDLAPDRLTVSVETGEEALLSLRPEWETLWNSSSEATQFQRWDYLYYYWKHFRASRPPQTIVLRDGSGTPLVIVPLLRAREWKSGLSHYSILGEDSCDYHLFLSREGLPESAALRVAELILARFSKASPLLAFTNVPEDSLTARAISTCIRNRPDRASPVEVVNNPAFSVPLPRHFEGYLRLLSPERRRRLRYEQRRLESTCKVTFRTFETPGDVAGAYRDIEKIDLARWGLASRFTVARKKEHAYTIAGSFARAGIWKTSVLYVDGVPAAFVEGAVVRRSYIIPRTGYDPTILPRLSTGKMVHLYAIRDSIERGLDVYDLTRGREDYKRWLGCEEHCNLHYRIYRSNLDRAAYLLGSALLSRLRRSETLRGFYQRRVRRLFKRGER